ncbi:MAG: alpha/beta hydrolase [Bacilli bacterium]|jgi:alpha-beta hydrolase superfamily lysophospholipase
MAREKLTLKLKNGEELFGYSWKIDKPIANVVILTGMEEHSLRYDHFANFLNENGYSAYCVDHYGQGENADEPKQLGVWPSDAFAKSVENTNELVGKLHYDNFPVYLFGHSMGSFVVQSYIQKYSKNVDKVILSGTNGPNKLMIGLGYFLSRLIVNNNNREQPSKFLRSLMLEPYTKAIKDHKTKTDWLSFNEENVRKYNEDPKCGFLYESKKSFYREFLKGLNGLHKMKSMKNIRADLPILLIAGAEDPVGNNSKGVLKLVQLYKDLGIKDAQPIIYPYMRHEVLNETDNVQVYRDVMKFIKEEHANAKTTF